MRFFADGVVPGLTLLRGELPAPWILPSTFSESHRERLVRLLGAGLRRGGFDLCLVRLNWSERARITPAGLGLPATTLLWWEMDLGKKESAESAWRESLGLHSGPTLFFFPQGGPDYRAWLGSLKVRVLHALCDHLQACRLPTGPESVVEELNRWTAQLPSPLDPVDLCEELILAASEGLPAPDRAFVAMSRFLARRLADTLSGQESSALILALSEMRGGDPSSTARALLARQELWEQEAPTPLGRLLLHEGVFEKTLQELSCRIPLDRPLTELVPDLGWKTQGTSAAESAPLLALLGLPMVASAPWQESLVSPQLEDQIAPARKWIEKAAQVTSQQDEAPSEANLERGLAYTKAAIQALKPEERQRLEASLMRQAAHMLKSQGRFGDALAQLQEALPLSRRAHRLDELARTLADMADLWVLRGHLPQATRAVEEALRLAKDLKEPGLRAWVSLVAAQVSMRENQTGRAMDLLERSFHDYLESNNKVGQAAVLRARGELRRFKDDLAGADQDYARALRLYETVEDRLGQANVLRVRGELRRFKSDLAGAEQDYARALELYEIVEDRLGQANVLLSRGNLWRFKSDLAGAEQDYARALELYEAVEEPLGQANVLLLRGNLRRFKSDLAGADQDYARALELYEIVEDRPGQANIMRCKGALALQRGEDPELYLLRSLSEAQDIPDPHGVALSHLLLASHELLTRPDTAREHLEFARSWAVESGAGLELHLAEALSGLLRGEEPLVTAATLAREAPHVPEDRLRQAAVEGVAALIHDIALLIPTYT